MTRKLLIFLTILTLLLGAVATVSAQSAQGEDAAIGVMLPSVNGDFYDGMIEGLNIAAETLGVTLTILDSEYDLELEAENIATLIEDGVDALLFTPVDAVESLAVIEAANEADIPVFLIGENAELSAAEVEIVSLIGIDNTVGGEAAAEYVCASLEDGGTVLELSVTFEQENALLAEVYAERSAAFAAYLDETCEAEFTIEALDMTGVRARDMVGVIGDALLESEAVAVYAHNENLILGSVRPVLRNDLDVLLIGYDATEDTLGALQIGSLDAVVSVSGADLGVTGLETALAFLDGDEVEDKVSLNPFVVNAEAIMQVRDCNENDSCQDN